MTDFMNANTINDLIRSIFALLDRVAYWVLGFMYEILFNVASADIFSNETIKNFYGRIQLILGVFMIFKLAVTIIQGILNPDTFTDKKSGFGNIISRVITAIVLLAVLTPINIPAARSEYEIQLNNNGLLFGTLYSLQTRILENNTLGRLILGTTDNATGGPSTDDDTLTGADKQAAKLKQSANIFTSTVLKGFVRLNVKGKDENGETLDDETNPDHRVCEYVDQETLDVYTAYDASPNEILALINASCETQGGFFSDILALYPRLTGKDKYIFAYMPVISTVVAVIFIWILLGEIITIAIRSIKLAVLRLIAPIPIISHIQPSKDGGAFGAWTKALTSTYLELFLHLAVIYFIIFLIQDMIVNGIVINTGTGVVGIISMIFIWIGMFFFIKQAPKFIMNVLGIKSSGGNLGLSGILAATGAIRQGGTFREAGEAFMDTARANTNAYNQGKGAPPIGLAFDAGRDHVAKILTGDNNMTGRMMTRGTRHLNAMGIDRFTVDTADKDKKAKAEIAANLKDQYTRYTDGHMGAHEKAQFEAANSALIAHYEGEGYSHDDAIGKAMYKAMSDAETASLKAAKKHEKMEGMQKKYGQSRSYEAKYNDGRGNRAVMSGGTGADPHHYGSVQKWREQYVPDGSSGDSTTPRDSGAPDMTGPGATTPGGGFHGGGPGGPGGGHH